MQPAQDKEVQPISSARKLSLKTDQEIFVADANSNVLENDEKKSVKKQKIAAGGAKDDEHK